MTALKEVSLKEVSRAFGRRYALHRVTQRFESGTCSAVLGNNGAGKTTLLNLLATVDMPSRGEILFDGAPSLVVSRKYRHLIGWLGHQTQLYSDLTGRENLRFFAQMYGLKEPEERVSRWLRRVNMDEASDRRVSTYSRGMVQRISLARALIHKPSLVLLDEPFTGLDQDSKGVVAELLKQLVKSGAIVVLVTHDLMIDDALVDHVIWLQDGALIRRESTHKEDGGRKSLHDVFLNQQQHG